MNFKGMLIKLVIKVTPPILVKSWFNLKVLWFKFILRKEFRLSCAGLIKITTSNGKNLLVASKRVRHKYQLPGGVCWYYNSWADRSILEQDEVMNNIPKNDMRFKVKRGQEFKIPSILDKFEKGFDREPTPKREFFEELIETNILDKDLFCSPDFYKSCLHSVDFELTKGKKGGFCSFYRFEIFEMILNEEQQKFIDELAEAAKISSKYVFATKYELIKGLPDESGAVILFPEFVKNII